MTQCKLVFPDDLRKRLVRCYETNRGAWLGGEGTWPLATVLGVLREKEVQSNGDLVRQWVKEWSSWGGPGCVAWQERHWPAMGTQRIPKSLTLYDPDEVTVCIGVQEQWHRAVRRYNRFIEQWPSLKSELSRLFDMLSEYSEDDCNRLYALLTWLAEHPTSNLYLRQLPVPGLDSKWIEKRRSLVIRLFTAIRDRQHGSSDLYRLCGLRPPPHLVRMRLLDTDLRSVTGGLSDITAPIGELAHLPITPRCAFIVENVQTALAFGELNGTVLIMGLGYAVEVLGELPWLSRTPCIYWGDMDTHGFAILSRVRGYLQQTVSCLMDERTLLEHRELWGNESQPHSALELPNLTPAEQKVYQGLKNQHWGINVRLEQERIYWPSAWNEIEKAYAHLLRILSG